MSKGLESLEKLKNIDSDIDEITIGNEFSHLFTDIEKELNAFELIKTKEVEPTVIYNNYKNYDGYLAEMEKYYVSHNLQRDREEWNKNYVLTKEEFDFLNDVFFENEEEELQCQDKD